MHHHTLAALLLAPVLLLSALGCSTLSPVPVLPAPGTARYQLDGATVYCRASARASTGSSTPGGPPRDYLEVELTTAPPPQSGAETLTLYFDKTPGQPASAYQLSRLESRNSQHPAGVPYDNVAATLAPFNSAAFSGTFSGRRTSGGGAAGPTTQVLSDGVFTNVAPN